MAKMKELTVQMANKPGTLAALGQALGKAKVNVLAFMTDEAGGQSQTRLVADNPAKATAPFNQSLTSITYAMEVDITHGNTSTVLSRPQQLVVGSVQSSKDGPWGTTPNSAAIHP